MFVAGVLFFEQYLLVSLLLLLISFTIFTARYRFTINLTNQTYYDYLWIAGFRKGGKQTFSSINGLHLTENLYRQTFSNFSNSTTVRGTEYNGYVRFDDQNVHLLSDTRKKSVLKKLAYIQSKLRGNIVSRTDLVINSDITDHTGG